MTDNTAAILVGALAACIWVVFTLYQRYRQKAFRRELIEQYEKGEKE